MYKYTKKSKRITLILVSMLCMLIFSVIANAGGKQLNPETTLTWGNHYSWAYESENGEFYYPDCVEYKFNVPSSGKVSFALTLKIAYQHLGVDGLDIKILNSAGGEVAKEEVKSGTETVAFDLLAGDYTVCALPADYQLGYDFFMIPSFKASGETRSERYTAKNDEVTSATPYKLGKKVKAQLAINDTADVYSFNMKKYGLVEIKLNSGLNKVNVGLTNQFGDIKYVVNDIAMGQKTLTFFVPSGTAYLSFEKEDSTGTYSFSCVRKDVPKTVLRGVSNPWRGGVKATWKRVANVDGYQVQVAKDKKFTTGKKSAFVDAAVSSTKISGLKTKTKYYVRVRSFVKCQNNKRYYSAWSNVKSITLNKK